MTSATGSDKVFSLFSVRRRLAAIVLSASALLKSPEPLSAAAALAANGLCNTGDGDNPNELSSMPRLTAVAMWAAEGWVAAVVCGASACSESCSASASVVSVLGELDKPDMAGPACQRKHEDFTD